MRLDKYLSAGEFSSRTKAARAIEKGLVLLNGKRAKPSDEVGQNDIITLLEAEESFVSEGGYKLSKALSSFDISVKDKVFADIGASTGGFTDVLLQNGARRVYAVDVGSCQLDEKLRNDGRVIVMDDTNARNLGKGDFGENLDGVVADVSFISLTYILPVISEILGEGGSVFVLIKPQFECGASALDKRGVVKSGKNRRQAIEKIYDFSVSCNLAPQSICTAPEKERKNREYVLYLIKGGKPTDKEKIIGIEKQIP